MYFISKQARWYSFALSLNGLQRYGLTCAVGILLIIVWYLLIYTPLCQLVQEHDLEQSATYQHIRQLTDQQRQYQVRVRDKRKEYLQMRADYSAHSPYRLFDICTDISESGLQFISFVPEEKISGIWYKKQRGQFCFAGDFFTILKFFQQLLEHGSGVQCRSFQLSKKNDVTISCVCTIEKLFLKDTANGI